ncbi:hypothetical protein GY45DRAFT_1125253 [Cubamyces sp. BRFM 1775]|nr:hypothetical protein GY45DRAFT_1125253 [Cubamyces sp. BRFM 1775]
MHLGMSHLLPVPRLLGRCLMRFPSSSGLLLYTNLSCFLGHLLASLSVLVRCLLGRMMRRQNHWTSLCHCIILILLYLRPRSQPFVPYHCLPHLRSASASPLGP